MQFLLNVIDDGQAVDAGRTASATQTEMDAIDVFNARLQAEGRILVAQGLSAPADAVVIDGRDARQPTFTPGSFSSESSYVAGFWVLEADDIDEARALGAEASAACNRRIEVRQALSEA